LESPETHNGDSQKHRDYFFPQRSDGLDGRHPEGPGRGATDLKRLLEDMLDRSRIAEFPQPEFVCKQASSYNRRSITPGNPDWLALLAEDRVDLASLSREDPLTTQPQMPSWRVSKNHSYIRNWLPAR